jgi:excinuclease ABC subunit C
VKIKNLPSSPGVYLMKDSLSTIIYVGKSKNLKSRVGSYFHSSKFHSPKVEKLVKNIKDFDYILTDTEFEAFMLECNLIKEIKPPYNKKMKNPLSYTYIKIKRDHTNIEISQDAPETDDNIYIGPYTSKNTVERAIQGIKEFYKIQCSNNFRSSSPCLNYSLGLCIGMCFDIEAKAKLYEIMGEIIKLLSGVDNTILYKMELNMKEAAEKLDFDTAAKYRDYITAVKSLINKEKVIEFTQENKNIALLEYIDKNTLKFFLIYGTKILFSKKYELLSSHKDNLKVALRNNILYYLKCTDLNNTVEIGRNEIDESQIIYSYLKSKQNNCKYIVIPATWIRDENIINIDAELKELFQE